MKKSPRKKFNKKKKAKTKNIEILSEGKNLRNYLLSNNNIIKQQSEENDASHNHNDRKGTTEALGGASLLFFKYE